MNVQIGEYDVDSVILDLGSDINILTKKTWEKMGKLWYVWSLVQLRLENKARVSPIDRVPHIPIEVEGLKTYAYFNIIEIVDISNSYPVMLGISRENDNLEVINFKKRVMTFENCDMRIITPLDPNEVQRCMEPEKRRSCGGMG